MKQISSEAVGLIVALLVFIAAPGYALAIFEGLVHFVFLWLACVAVVFVVREVLSEWKLRRWPR